MTAGHLTPMHRFVVDQLQARRGSWRVIADALTIPYGTLRKIANGERKDPTVGNIETLATHFGWIGRAPARAEDKTG